MPKSKQFILSISKFISKRWKLLLIILLVAGAAFFWYFSKTKAKTEALVFSSPTRQDLTKTLDISGFVDATEKVRLRFAAGGKVTYLGANEGDFVNKYQTIASIDTRTLQKQMQQDLNTYMQERWDWEDTLDNTKDRWIDTPEQRQVDKNQWDLDNKVLNVEIRNIAIQNSAITAPFAGILTVSPTPVAGVQLLATDYFELVNPDTLIFSARIDEADIAQVTEGLPAVINLDSYPDMTINTHIDYIAFTSSQTSSGTVFQVDFPLSSVADASKLRLGMNGDAAIELATAQNVLTVPITAIRQRGGQTYVDVRTGEKSYEERAISIGLETEDWVEVLEGLSESDEILLPE